MPMHILVWEPQLYKAWWWGDRVYPWNWGSWSKEIRSLGSDPDPTTHYLRLWADLCKPLSSHLQTDNTMNVFSDTCRSPGLITPPRVENTHKTITWTLHTVPVLKFFLSFPLWPMNSFHVSLKIPNSFSSLQLLKLFTLCLWFPLFNMAYEFPGNHIKM